jgi:hypothetical protein
MQENKRWKGYFFLPENPGDKKAGILRYVIGDKIELELFGSFNTKRNFQPKSIPLINGIIEGKYVTLYKNFESNFSFKINAKIDTNFSTYQSHFIFFGAQFKNKNELKFIKANFRFTYLEEWLNKRKAFELEQSEDDKTIEIRYTNPQPFLYKIEDFDFEIRYGYKSSPVKFYLKKFGIKQIAHLRISNTKKIKFEELLSRGLHFQKFLTIAAQIPIQIKSLNLFFKPEENRKSCELYYVSYNSENKEINRTNIFFEHSQIENKFPDILKKWYSNRCKLEISIDTLLRTYYSKSFSTDSFLNVIKAMESYHREFIYPKEETLKNRLKKLFNRTENVFNDYLKIQEKDKFYKKLKNYRHDLTHSNPIVKQQPYKIEEIFKLTEKAKLILICNILIDHKISKSEVKEFINTSNVFSHIAG